MKRITQQARIVVLLVALTTIVGCPFLTPVVEAPVLQVFPGALSFGDVGTVDSFNIFNEGGGTLTYTVTTDAPWLTIQNPTGSTTTETDRINISANRNGLNPGSFQGTITITSNGGTATIPVDLGVAGTPVLQASPNVLNFFGGTTMSSFTVSNSGTDDLTWTIQAIDTATNSLGALPSFITVNPLTSTTVAGGSTNVDVTIDPNALPEGSVSVTLIIESNNGTAQVVINAGEPTVSTGVIGVDPQSLDFGETNNVLTFSVMNTGEENSVLNFSVASSNAGLVSVNPSNGISIGSASQNDLDNVEITVTLDRAQLTADGQVATLTVSAAGADSVQVPINATRAPLTLEGATNRTRPPFILRFVFLIRDALGMPVDASDPAVLADIQAGLRLEENGELLDLNETNLFLQATGDSTALRTTMVLLLDYTGSMFNAPPGNGVVIDQMESAATSFINDLPSSIRLAIMEHHDRNQPTFLMANFTTNRADLTQALSTFSVPSGFNGSSLLYDALINACERIANDDIGLAPFDEADQRAIVFISDGRDTSSESNLQSVITTANELRCRLFPIGFGENVRTDDLVMLADETGGHYYAAPTVTDLVALLESGTNFGGQNVGRIVADLQQQVILTYISLLGGQGTYLITLELDGNTGSFHRDAFVAFGDTRAGQMSLRANPVNAGSTQMTIRTDYVPRAISQVRFRLFVPAGVSIDSVQFAPNGLMDDGSWVILDEGGGIYTAVTNETSALPFGSFGDLFTVNLSGAAAGDIINFRVDNRIYIGPPFTVYFAYPDEITLNTITSQAGSVVLQPGGIFDPENPFGLGANFNPDAPLAFDRDEDLTVDFDDIAPLDDEIPN